MEQSDTQPTKTTAILRGVIGRCPHCGKGALFKAYLKQNDACPVCGADFSRLRADDGPAWLTILLTGHIIIPVAVYVAMHDFLPEWIAVCLMLILTTAIVLAMLPRSKGLFVAALWLLARKKAAPASP